jgi:hypothetical protein
MAFSSNGLFEREIGLAVFLARPTHTQTALCSWIFRCTDSTETWLLDPVWQAAFHNFCFELAYEPSCACACMPLQDCDHGARAAFSSQNTPQSSFHSMQPSLRCTRHIHTAHHFHVRVQQAVRCTSEHNRIMWRCQPDREIGFRAEVVVIRHKVLDSVARKQLLQLVAQLQETRNRHHTSIQVFLV